MSGGISWESEKIRNMTCPLPGMNVGYGNACNAVEIGCAVGIVITVFNIFASVSRTS